MNGTNLKLDMDLRNMLVSNMIPQKGSLDLRYRMHRRAISTLCSYARTKGVDCMDLSFFKEKAMEILNTSYFSRVDKDFQNPNGIVFRDESRVGAINGLGVSRYYEEQGGLEKSFNQLFLEEMSSKNSTSTDVFIGFGSRIGILSVLEKGNMLPNSKEDRFTNVDKNFTNALPNSPNYMTQKSHHNVASWVTNLIGSSDKVREILNREDWRVKTQFEEAWLVADGPSASGATAVTILSALFNQPVYTNRFMTGSFTQGEIGEIGGEYIKASVPHRFSQLYQEFGIDRPMYFMFPAANLSKMRSGLEVDILGLNDTISMIPISTIQQAYALATGNPIITEEDLKNAQEKGSDLISDGINNLLSRI